MAKLRQYLLRIAHKLPVGLFSSWPVRQLVSSPYALLGKKHFERLLLTYPLPGRQLAFANCRNVARQVLQDRTGEFPKSTLLGYLLKPLIGDGLFIQPGGEPVARARNLFMGALALCSNKDIAGVATSTTEDYLAKWATAGHEHPVAFCTEMSRLTIDVATQCTLGNRFSREDSLRFSNLFFEYHRHCQPVPLLLSGADHARLRRIAAKMSLEPIAREMRDLARRYFLEPMLEGETSVTESPFARAMVGSGHLSLNNGRLQGTEAQQHAALDEIMVMLLAGHETTASALSWLGWELAGCHQEQEAAARILGDTHAVSGAPEGESPDPNGQIDAPTIIEGLIQETLRLYPPIPFYLRETVSGCSFRGKSLVPDSLIVVSPWTLHRHRRDWEAPDDFVPCRWHRRNDTATSSLFLPFGMGPRTCPGAGFALVEMRTILNLLLKRCRLSRSDPSAKPQPLGHLSSRPDREIFLKVDKRRSA